MKIFIPYSHRYMKQIYGLGDSFISYIETEVIPYLVERLVLDSRVSSIDLLIDRESSINLAVNSNKLAILENRSRLDAHSEEILSVYIDSLDEWTAPIVQLNPLFPFLSLEKIHEHYQLVMRGEVETAVGAIGDGFLIDTELGLVGSSKSAMYPARSEAKLKLDIGAVTILKPENIANHKPRIKPPVCAYRLTSMELVNMRTSEDIDMYRLVINSGAI